MIELSIIIPTFNGEKYIADLIRSIENLNLDINDRTEIIIVDDGSSDKSMLVINSLLEEYTNIKVIKKDNGGIASARNLGLENAKGTFVAFCDQDDKVVSSYTSFLERIDKNECDMLVSGHQVGYTGHYYPLPQSSEDTICAKKEVFYMFEYLVGKDDLITEKQYASYHLPYLKPSIWNCIFRRSSIIQSEVKFHKFVDYEDDWLFMIDCLKSFDKIYITNDIFYSWTINQKSESHRKKYITDFFNKRLNLQGYLVNILNSMSYSSDIIEAYRNKMDAQTMMFGFYNATIQPYSSYIKEMRLMSKKIPYKNYGHYTIGRMSKIYFKLFRFKMFTLAFVMNKLLAHN